MTTYLEDSWTDEDWTTIWTAVTGLATVALFVGALIAALIAKKQLDDAKGARTQATTEAHDLLLEQIAPYVTIFMEPSLAAANAMDLVCKNFGQTAAADVKVTFDSEPRRSVNRQDPESIQWPDTIPTLAPGQEFRSWWDTGPEHMKSKLPMSIKASATYKDAHDRKLSSEAILDWEILRDRLYIAVKGTHDLTLATERIQESLASFREDPGGEKGVRVFVHDGKEKLERQATESQRFLERQDQQVVNISPEL